MSNQVAIFMPCRTEAPEKPHSWSRRRRGPSVMCGRDGTVPNSAEMDYGGCLSPNGLVKQGSRRRDMRNQLDLGWHMKKFRITESRDLFCHSNPGHLTLKHV